MELGHRDQPRFLPEKSSLEATELQVCRDQDMTENGFVMSSDEDLGVSAKGFHGNPG